MVKPPAAGWMGGKSRLAKQIIERIPAHTCYVEVFAGAGWVLFGKEPSKVEVLNDINLDLVTLYRCVQHHLEEFVRHLKWVLISRDEFARQRKVDPSTLDREEVRNIFKSFNITTTSTRYTCGRGTRPKAAEVFITNY